MNKNKSEKIERWIDLSALQKLKNDTINWQKSIGVELPFMYDNIFGKLKILKYIGSSKCMVLITTKDISIKCNVTSYDIRYCMFGRILQKPIGITHPELIKYFVNTDDAFKYPAHSHKRVDMLCPICGTIKKQQISILTDYGLGCKVCSDGISYAEKMMISILTQLKIDFISQVNKSLSGFEWIIKNYRYDFYININNQKIIIEMDGHMHVMDRFTSCNDIKKSDKEKDDIAHDQGISVIRIDCAYDIMNNRFEYIKSNILSSELAKLLNFSLVDWNIVKKDAVSSNVELASNAWNHGAYSSYEVSKILGVSAATAQHYLKIAGELGMCNYSIEEIAKRRGVLSSETKKKKAQTIAILKDDIIVGVFRGVTDAEKQSEKLYGVHLSHQNLSNAIRGGRISVNGYTVKCITHEEYEKLLPQFSKQYKINESLRKEEIYEAS